MTKAIKILSSTFLLFTAISLFSFSMRQEFLGPEKVNWRTHFLGEPDKNSPFYALTATRWHYSYHAKVRDKDLHIDFKFSAGVDPNESWVKLNHLKNAESKRKLLNHEQGHVNINFLLLKEGEQRIRFQSYTIKNYKKSIQENANKVSAYYRDMQVRYDKETKHGTDDLQQERWDQYIDEQLKKYVR